ncbi:MAG TPA: AAA family ATPase [Candidatus Absconditabacterales bacterium]|nr:AAA family ATPase [Candidatus Absconditabacterales bacterium]
MKLVIIFGPLAVGKMTVGQELEKETGLKLFHNHMTIELVAPFFDYGTETGKKLVTHFRQKIFEEVSKSDLKGMIFTYVWAFNKKSDWEYIDNLYKMFETQGAEVCFVELEADMNERLERNKSPNRLKHKPTKRKIKESDKHFREVHIEHKLNSNIGEIPYKNYIRIDNTNLDPNKVAKMIVEKFNL